MPYFKYTIRNYFHWIMKQVRELPIKIELGTAATEEYIARFSPDAIVVCTGSLPSAPPVKGIGKDNVKFGVDVLLDETGVGSNVVIVGSGLVGCELALHLAHENKKVTLIDMLPEIGREVNYLEKPVMMKKLNEYNVDMIPNLMLSEVIGDGIVVKTPDNQTKELKADTVILAAGLKPVDAAFEAVYARWQSGELTAAAAMRELGLKPNTFYRRARSYAAERL